MSDSKVQLFNFWNLCHICAENRSVSHPNPLCCSCESLFCQTNLLPRNHNFFCFKSEDVQLDSSHLQLPLCFHGYYFCSPAHGGEAFMCGVLTDAVLMQTCFQFTLKIKSPEESTTVDIKSLVYYRGNVVPWLSESTDGIKSFTLIQLPRRTMCENTVMSCCCSVTASTQQIGMKTSNWRSGP